VVLAEPFCAAVCGSQRTILSPAVATLSLVSPSNAGGCGAADKVLEITLEAVPILELAPIFVIALTRKNVAEPARKPVETISLVAVEPVLATVADHEVLLVLTSIL
jgi:hypothetical protein